MKKMKRFGAALLAIAMSAVLAFPAMAATYEYIDEVTLHISNGITVGEIDCDVDVTVDEDEVEVESVTITNEPEDQWDSGDDPEIKIVLAVTDTEEYRFDLKKSTVYSSEGKITSVSGSKSKRATITIKLPELEYDEGYYDDLLEVEGVNWDEGSAVAYWSENDSAVRYDVRLYRNDSAVGTVISTTDNSCDLAQYFTRKGEYYFKVRAVRSSTLKGDWTESDILEVDADEAAELRGTSTSSSTSSGSTTTTTTASTTEGTWVQNETGWWWCNPDRTYPASNWKKINGYWYYFNAAGYCVMNTWVQTDGKWYYCGNDGDMWVSRWTPDGYYVDANGVWVQ